jgi:hypothetical protein
MYMQQRGGGGVEEEERELHVDDKKVQQKPYDLVSYSPLKFGECT